MTIANQIKCSLDRQLQNKHSSPVIREKTPQKWKHFTNYDNLIVDQYQKLLYHKPHETSWISSGPKYSKITFYLKSSVYIPLNQFYYKAKHILESYF